MLSHKINLSQIIFLFLDCMLKKANDRLIKFQSAWPYKYDFSVYCTSFLENVISSILVGLDEDGYTNNLFKGMLAKFY
jgi:hypothetical protein